MIAAGGSFLKPGEEKMYFAATDDPVSDIEKAMLWLKNKKRPVTRKKVAEITTYTVTQIAGTLEREPHLKLFYNDLRARH